MTLTFIIGRLVKLMKCSRMQVVFLLLLSGVSHSLCRRLIDIGMNLWLQRAHLILIKMGIK